MSLQAYNSATDTLTPIAENDYKDSLEKVSALPTASADLLNKCYLLTANQGTYTKGNIYQCQSDGSSGYTWILINGSGVPVDIIEDGNMNAVTSNAVSDKFDTLGTASTKDYTDNVAPNNHNLVESNAVYNAIANSISAIYKPQGNLTCAELTSSLLIASNVGNVYNMTDSGTTSALFVQGSGTTINVNDTVGIIQTGVSEYKFNYMGNLIDLHSYQTKTLDTPLTIGGTQQTTVEGALGGLNTSKQDKLTNPLTKSDVVNNLNTTTTNVPLSANMGKALQDRLSTYKLLGSANTPTTARTAVTINFNENVNNFAFVFIKYGFGWGASHVVTIPTRVGLGVPFLPEIGHGGVPEQNNIRIEMSGNSCVITTGDYDYGTTASGAPKDTIQVYGVIRING